MNKVIGFLLLLFSLSACGQGKSEAVIQADESSETFPRPIGWVNDFADILSAQEIQALDSIIADFEKKTTSEIAIVTIDSIGNYETLFDYSIALANQWGIGKKDKNNGVLLMICPSIRQLRIQTGRGIENILTDQECQEIIDNEILPLLRENNWYAGITQGLSAIMQHLED